MRCHTYLMTDASAAELPIVELVNEESAALAHLVSIRQDFLDARSNCELLIALLDENEHQSDSGRGIEQALYTAIVVSYSRAFATGRRPGLSETDLGHLPPGALLVHRYIRKVRDQHVAHSVLPYDEVKVGIVLSADDPEPKVLGSGFLLLRRISDEASDIRNIRNLIDLFLARLEPLISEQQDRYEASARTLNAEQLHSLPMLETTIQSVSVSEHPPVP